MNVFNQVLSLLFCFVLFVPVDSYSTQTIYKQFNQLQASSQNTIDNQQVVIYCLVGMVSVLGVLCTVLFLKCCRSKNSAVVDEDQQCNHYQKIVDRLNLPDDYDGHSLDDLCIFLNNLFNQNQEIEEVTCNGECSQLYDLPAVISYERDNPNANIVPCINSFLEQDKTLQDRCNAKNNSRKKRQKNTSPNYTNNDTWDVPDYR